MTKSGKTRYITISEDLKAILVHHRRASGFVVQGAQKKRGKWIYRYEAQKLFRRVSRPPGCV